MSSITYRENLEGDVKKRYDEKTALISVDPYSIRKGEFSLDRNLWPDVTNMDIIQFLVYQQSAFSKDGMENYKSLQAYKYFQDGWVHK